MLYGQVDDAHELLDVPVRVGDLHALAAQHVGGTDQHGVAQFVGGGQSLLHGEDGAALADALLHVTPYYNKTSQTGLIRHFNAVADATDLPIILYNVPSRTGVNITPATYRELAKHPNIVAAKEASGNISQIAQIAQACGDELDLYSGNDDQIVPLLSLGAKGVISVLSNIMPRETHDICRLFFEGKIAESRALQLKLLPLINALFSDVNPIPVKEAMNMMGWECGECRLPLVSMQPQAKEHLRVLMQEQGLIKE